MSVTIERLGHLGDGVAAGPVFVPLTLPGEVVEGEIVDGRIADPKIVTPSVDRIRPPCRHFRACGGCALQHASDPFLEIWKVDVVATALEAQGLDAPVRDIAVSPPHSRRRATFSGRRTKKGALVGFHGRASDTIVEVPYCQILLPELVHLLPMLTELTRFGATRRGELSLAVTWSASGADLAVTGGAELDEGLRSGLAMLAGQAGLARLTWDGELVAEIAAPVQSFGGIETVPPPGAFLQATREGEVSLLDAVTEAVGDAGRIVDIFAGCGTFALPLARRAEVHATELEADSLKALDAAWRHARGLKRVTTEARDLFRRPLLASELARYDAIVIDPPRAGAEAQTREIAQSGVGRIASVSCNPTTFARDAAILAGGGYRLDWVRVVDQFRWSPHVELAAQFSKHDM